MTDMNKYPVLEIFEDHVIEREHLGTKTKFWVNLMQDGEEADWLYKIPRENTGEHWAEKVAFEVACLLDIDCAEVQLARFQDTLGSCSKSFINREKKPEMIHGNEIMAGQFADYEKDKKYGQKDHTLDNIVKAVRNTGSQSESERALKNFTGYLLLDGLIGNTDRHHENWAFLRWTDKQKQTHYVIAPTFDHASSLGRELLDEKRELILKEDRIEQYLNRGSGAIFANNRAKNGLNPQELVKLTNNQYPELLDVWFKQVEQLNPDHFKGIIERVPDEFITDTARTFALSLLKANLKTLKNLTV
jgi:hypothetical protein